MDISTKQTHESLPLECILVSVLVLFLSGSLRSAAIIIIKLMRHEALQGGWGVGVCQLFADLF